MNRQLQQRRRRRQRERHKTIRARAFMFLYISLLSPAKQHREMSKLKFFGREFFMFPPYLNTVSINLVPAHLHTMYKLNELE